nr:unnamed protein product [Spirometra erinaceieuropaei]
MSPDYPTTQQHLYLAPYLNDAMKDAPILVLTGRLESTPMEFKVVYSDSLSQVITLVPADVSDPIPTTIRVAFSGVHHLKPWKFLLCLLPAIMKTLMH